MDVGVSAAALVFFSPVLILIAVLVKASSRGPILFVQERVGMGGVPFRLLKFRTMVAHAPALGPTLTIGADPRVTRIGVLLRRFKLDELPQFANVLRGDMSLVGPRPEVPNYVAHYTASQRAVLAVRPGITDPASLTYHDEASFLEVFEDPERAYREVVLPEKLNLSLEYLRRRTIATDLGIIARTALRMLGPSRAPNEGFIPEADTPKTDLRKEVASGIKWSASSYYADTALRLMISILFARLLSPAEFGVMALATALVGFLTMMQESGLSAALIQHRGRIDTAATTALVMTAATGLLLGAAACLVAPWVALQLDHAELAGVLQALAVLFVVRGVTHAPRALLQRAMLFKGLSVVQLSSTVVYGAVGVVCATQGAGVWSLVWATIFSEVWSSLGAWFYCPWRPRWRDFDPGAGRELARFGRHVLGANVLDVLREQFPAVLIGKLLGAEPLGYYWISKRWASLPTEGITWVITRVSYPTFVRLQDDRERFASSYLLALSMIMALAVPAGVGLSLVADPLVRTLYDTRWLGAVLPLRILAFYGLFLAIAASTGEVFKAAGTPRYVLFYSALYTITLGVMLFWMGTSAGLPGIALATVLAPAGIAVAALGSTCKLLRLRYTSVVTLLVVPVQGTAAMTMGVLGTAYLLTSTNAPAWAQLILEISCGALIYAAITYHRDPEWLATIGAVLGKSKGSAFLRSDHTAAERSG